jgi:phosphate transport system ATP-binding protein
MDAITTHKLNLFYGDFHAIKSVDMAVAPRRITAIIGPSGCGKSTLLRVFNRMNDLIEGVRVSGECRVFGKPLFGMDIHALRKDVGMVFQRPNPFPQSIFDNIVYGLRVHGIHKHAVHAETVERCLAGVGLWKDLKDRLKENALELTGEQQQRLCIARVLAVKPEILLMDEPCSALDPIATAHIEELMGDLKKEYTIIIVTHNMQQAARVSDDCGFMLLGELVEFGDTSQIFTSPRDARTEDYITGRFG